MVLPVVSSVAVPVPQVATPAIQAMPDRVAAFDAALVRGDAGLVPATPAPPVAPAAQTDEAGALDRARAGFGLEPASAVGAPAEGDMILQGMQKLRGIFDGGQERIGAIMDKSGTDASSLIQMQLELTNFTLMVDMSSKLTGKTTQVFDTLMKGQ